jgi:hypothetical protein
MIQTLFKQKTVNVFIPELEGKVFHVCGKDDCENHWDEPMIVCHVKENQLDMVTASHETVYIDTDEIESGAMKLTLMEKSKRPSDYTPGELIGLINHYGARLAMDGELFYNMDVGDLLTKLQRLEDERIKHLMGEVK